MNAELSVDVAYVRFRGSVGNDEPLFNRADEVLLSKKQKRLAVFIHAQKED